MFLFNKYTFKLRFISLIDYKLLVHLIRNVDWRPLCCFNADDILEKVLVLNFSQSNLWDNPILDNTQNTIL